MRFFVQPQHWHPPHFLLGAEEAHHAHTVLRLKPGSQVRVFQGEGEEWLAQVSFSSQDEVKLEGLEPVREAKLPAQILLLQALPKGSKMELIISKAVELGVSEVWPVAATRSVMRLDTQQAAKKSEKWQRLAREAAKQCGHPCLPPVHQPQTLRQCLQQLGQSPVDLLLLTSLQENTQPLLQSLQQLEPQQPAAQDSEGKNIPRIAILIGPEGDFTTEEIQLCLEAGAVPVSLGPLVLRTETAALSALAQLMAGLSFSS